jgi:hypothetical protein
MFEETEKNSDHTNMIFATVSLSFALLSLWCKSLTGSMLTEGYYSDKWIEDFTRVDKDQKITFIVALELNNPNNMMHDEFLSVSMPKSSNYGKFLCE